jgi:hypothetical protein
MNKPLKDSLQGPFYDLKEDDEIEEDIEQEGDIITERNVRISFVCGLFVGNLLFQRFIMERSWTDSTGIAILAGVLAVVFYKIALWLGLIPK